jgi:hypothetical protein
MPPHITPALLKQLSATAPKIEHPLVPTEGYIAAHYGWVKRTDILKKLNSDSKTVLSPQQCEDFTQYAFEQIAPRDTRALQECLIHYAYDTLKNDSSVYATQMRSFVKALVNALDTRENALPEIQIGCRRPSP